jgi:hypothetical protein
MVCSANRILDFYFFQIIFLFIVLYDVIFHVTAQFECEVFDFIQEILQVPWCWSIESRPLTTKRILTHLYLQI